jgi:diguanylate cyclase (GGDEF)-like protein
VLIDKYHVPKSRRHLQFEAESIRPLILPELVEIGYMNPERWLHMVDAFAEVGMGKADFSLDGFMYNPNPPRLVEQLKKTILYGKVAGGFGLFILTILLMGWFRLKKEIRRRKSAEKAAKQLAYHDPLTGIPNRNSFIPYAEKQLLSAQRKREKIALCFIDLNSFKAINDNYGHHAGDALLIHVARAITDVIRGSDMAARIGGDEFVVLLLGIHDVDDTLRTINTLRQVIARPLHFEHQTFSASASIGVAVFPDDGKNIDELMLKADGAMFSDKILNKRIEHVSDDSGKIRYSVQESMTNT